MIPSQVTKPKWELTKEDVDDHTGWMFATREDEFPGATPDPLMAAKSVRDIYVAASKNYSGKFTVPVCCWPFSCVIVAKSEGLG